MTLFIPQGISAGSAVSVVTSRDRNENCCFSNSVACGAQIKSFPSGFPVRARPMPGHPSQSH